MKVAHVYAFAGCQWLGRQIFGGSRSSNRVTKWQVNEHRTAVNDIEECNLADQLGCSHETDGEPQRPKSPFNRLSGTSNPDFRTPKVKCVWWKPQGPIYWELMQHGQTITAKVCCEQLVQVCAKLGFRFNPVIFLHATKNHIGLV